MIEPELRQSDVEAIIAATHTRPGIETYAPDDEMQARFERFCWNHSDLSASEFQLWFASAESYSRWNPANIECFLSNDVSEDRLDELLHDAEPTART